MQSKPASSKTRPARVPSSLASAHKAVAELPASAKTPAAAPSATRLTTSNDNRSGSNDKVGPAAQPTSAARPPPSLTASTFDCPVTIVNYDGAPSAFARSKIRLGSPRRRRGRKRNPTSELEMPLLFSLTPTLLSHSAHRFTALFLFALCSLVHASRGGELMLSDTAPTGMLLLPCCTLLLPYLLPEYG